MHRACRSRRYLTSTASVNGGYEPEPGGLLQNRPSVGNAGYLNDEAVQSLTARLDELRDRYDVDVAVVIDDQMWGDSAEEAADNTYDYCFYGAGVDDDGVLLYISKEPRMYQITTFGSGITAFTDYGIEYMQSLIVPKLQNDDYYLACMAYANGADELLRQAADGTPYDVGSDDVELTAGERTGASLGFGIILALIIALIASAISTRIKVNQMNTAREQADAHGYMKPGSFGSQTRQDVFQLSPPLTGARSGRNRLQAAAEALCTCLPSRPERRRRRRFFSAGRLWVMGRRAVRAACAECSQAGPALCFGSIYCIWYKEIYIILEVIKWV